MLIDRPVTGNLIAESTSEGTTRLDVYCLIYWVLQMHNCRQEPLCKHYELPILVRPIWVARRRHSDVLLARTLRFGRHLSSHPCLA